MRRVNVQVNGQWHVVEIESLRRSPVEVRVDGESYLVELEGLTTGSPRVRSAIPSVARRPRGFVAPAIDTKVILAPMPGKVVSVAVKRGDTVAPGTLVCVLETMKMEQNIQATQEGVVRRVQVRPGRNVAQGDVLIELR